MIINDESECVCCVSPMQTWLATLFFQLLLMGVKVIWIPLTTAATATVAAVKKNIHYHYNIPFDGADGGPFFNSKVFAVKHIKLLASNNVCLLVFFTLILSISHSFTTKTILFQRFFLFDFSEASILEATSFPYGILNRVYFVAKSKQCSNNIYTTPSMYVKENMFAETETETREIVSIRN